MSATDGQAKAKELEPPVKSYQFSLDQRSPKPQQPSSARVAPIVPSLSVAPRKSSAENDSDSANSRRGNEEEAKRPPLAAPSAGNNASSGRHTGRSVSSRDAWSVPATPRSSQEPPPGATVVSPRSPSKITAPSTHRSPRPAQPAIAEEAAAEDERDERPSSPLRSLRPAPPRLGAGSVIGAAPRYDLPPVQRGARGSLDPAAVVVTSASPTPAQRALTLAPLQGSPSGLRRKKRKVVVPGSNFAQNMAAGNRLQVVNPLKQLFEP